MDTALPQKFPFILDRNLAKANCTGNRVCTSCDTVVLDFDSNLHPFFVTRYIVPLSPSSGSALPRPRGGPQYRRRASRSPWCACSSPSSGGCSRTSTGGGGPAWWPWGSTSSSASRGALPPTWRCPSWRSCWRGPRSRRRPSR